MGLFRKKKVVVDDRTDLEKKFEETGQKVGMKTGKLVQKGLNKAGELKTKHNLDEKIVKVKQLATKAEDKIDDFVDVVTEKGKEVYNKVKQSKDV